MKQIDIRSRTGIRYAPLGEGYYSKADILLKWFTLMVKYDQ